MEDNKKIRALRRQLQKLRRVGTYSDDVPRQLREQLRKEIEIQRIERVKKWMQP